MSSSRDDCAQSGSQATVAAISSDFRGEVVIFDRSWYNRAGVKYVMGFCTEEQHRRFLEVRSVIYEFIVGGIMLIKSLARDRQGRTGDTIFGTD
jgi:polyphosphate kinase 2 (PPK2 family)